MTIVSVFRRPPTVLRFTDSGLRTADSRCILISAGEVSGFLFADLLEREIKKLNPEVRVVKLDVSYGLGPTLGLWEGARRMFSVGRLLRHHFFYVQQLNPDVLVLIGFPGVNLFLGKKFRKLGIPVVYLAAPQIWAWGSFRVKLLRQAVNRVFCLFLFEERLLRSLGIDAVYYGYPLLDSVKSTLKREEVLSFLGFNSDTKYIVLLPGSRSAETKFHQPLFLRIFNRLKRRYLGLKGVVIGGFGNLAEGQEVIRIPPEKRYEVIRHAHLALVVSGTATAETAILGTPEVASYHFTQPGRFLARLMVKLRYFSIPNIVADSMVIPEFLSPDEERLYQTAQRLFSDEVYREKIRAGLARVKELLGPPGAMAKIAAEILQLTTPCP
ncbi:MAG: hypothetical protein ABIK39_05115 [candidate division WOR-3 bacterium]